MMLLLIGALLAMAVLSIAADAVLDWIRGE